MIQFYLAKKLYQFFDKIFSIYCRDEFGNIVIKNDKNYLDYMLLDYNTSEEVPNNCDGKKSFTRNEENFLSYLELLGTSHKLKFNEDNFKIYTPFYDIELIGQVKEDNVKEFDPNKNLLNFLETNKYLEETNSDHELAGSAQYWYAETFRIRQLYTDAASAYLEGYQKYPKGKKAPINLLKLGVSMVQIGEKDQGCKMINGVELQYPNANQSVIQKAKYESKKFDCTKQDS